MGGKRFAKLLLKTVPFLLSAAYAAYPVVFDLPTEAEYTRADIYRIAGKNFDYAYALADSYAYLPFTGFVSFKTKKDFRTWACADARAQGYRCRDGKVLVIEIDSENPLNLITVDGAELTPQRTQ